VKTAAAVKILTISIGRRSLLFALCVALVFNLGPRVKTAYDMATGTDVHIGLVYDPVELERHPEVRNAWDGYLEEQGVPHAWISEDDLLLMSAGSMVGQLPALIFPDSVAQYVSGMLASGLAGYVKEGGTLVLVADSGTKREDGRFLYRGVFDSIAGVEFLRYSSLRSEAFGHGSIRFSSLSAARRWHVPFGKLGKHLQLSTYEYGPQRYPISRTSLLTDDTRVEAWSDSTPAITERDLGEGHVFFIDLPVGYLRSHTDGFPLHAVVRRALFDVAEVPHLVASPDGIGYLVVNWHIDSNSEWPGIPNFQRQRLLRNDLHFDFDVTAGPDMAQLNDDEGFDACGRGRYLLLLIAHYGRIGSHGGWAHNMFAYQIEHNLLSRDDIISLIQKNNQCLSSVTHYPILDYAPPDGAQPQPVMTLANAALGMIAYYYTGDTGTPAERAMYGGGIVSKGVWAFPITPLGYWASIGEMAQHGVAASLTSTWLGNFEERAREERTINLFYSHSYDMENDAYDPAMRAFLDKLERDQRAGLLRVGDMVEAAQFMQRFVKTSAVFTHQGQSWHVELSNDLGLRHIAFALPRETASTTLPPGIRFAGEDGAFRYFVVDTDTERYVGTL
jgi:hypothetical protein